MVNGGYCGDFIAPLAGRFVGLALDESAVDIYGRRMSKQRITTPDPIDLGPQLPVWIDAGVPQSTELMAFRSGVSLSVLDAWVRTPAFGVPTVLLGHLLALRAATATSALEGRMAREPDIRDAYYLTPTGQPRGPDGDLLAFWRGGAGLRLDRGHWRRAVERLVGADVAANAGTLLDAAADISKGRGPLAGCVDIIGKVLARDDRAERVACLLSDVALARALMWPMVLPVSAVCLTKSMLRDVTRNTATADLAVQQGILASVDKAIPLARDLAQKARGLRAIAPKLRTKGAEAAVNLFLTQDAVAPSTMLSPMIQGSDVAMTDRAARRFCDRLVQLGVARELTGRSTFRLYGL